MLMLRPGFIEALGRRAAFTRRHRGAFAAPLDGDAHDSSDAPAGYHAGDRVLFAWHHRDGTIGCATFDTAGRQVGGLQAFGGGRWPRVAVQRGRSAIASVDDNNLAVRIHDADRWQDPVTLPGPQGTIAFAADGMLVAATADGLWRLEGGSFSRLRDGAYARPSLAVDAGGDPHVAFERGDDVWCDDERIGRGRRPSIVAAPDGTLHVAWISGDTIQLRQRAGRSWAAETTVPVRNPSWVALALEDDRVRLTCLGPAPVGPQALWLLRLPDPSPILMPSVSGNVTRAWLMYKFELRGPRSSYRPHDLQVAFNGETVQAFENDVAEGRYLFRLDPRKIRTSPARPMPNDVQVNSRHTNGGHYMINNDFDLIVQTAWSERWGFATSDAELLAEKPANVNDDRPDLVLLANTLRMPMAAPDPGPMQFDVLVMNIGEVASQQAEVVLTAGDRALSRTAVRALEPGDDESVAVPFDYDGETDCVELRIAGATGDFSPASNVLTLHLWVGRANSSPQGAPPAARATSAPLSSEPAADFTLPLVSQPGVFRLSDVPGDVVLINWWRTSCPWSQKEAPKLAALYQRYRHRGFEILGVSDDTADTVGDIERYRRERDITWPIALNDQGEFLREVVPQGRGDTSANYLITRSGRLIRLGLDRGDTDWARLEEAVSAALDEPLPAVPSFTRREQSPAPPLAGTDLEGRLVDLADLAGRPVIVNFFDASTCDWAGRVLADLHQRYSPQGLRVLGVNLFDDDEAVRVCVQRHNIAFPVVRGTRDMAREWGLKTSAWATFLLTAEGRIFKTISSSIESGLEGEVFWRYAEFLLLGRPGDPRFLRP